MTITTTQAKLQSIRLTRKPFPHFIQQMVTSLSVDFITIRSGTFTNLFSYSSQLDKNGSDIFDPLFLFFFSQDTYISWVECEDYIPPPPKNNALFEISTSPKHHGESPSFIKSFHLFSLLVDKQGCQFIFYTDRFSSGKKKKKKLTRQSRKEE